MLGQSKATRSSPWDRDSLDEAVLHQAAQAMSTSCNTFPFARALDLKRESSDVVSARSRSASCDRAMSIESTHLELSRTNELR